MPDEIASVIPRDNYYRIISHTWNFQRIRSSDTASIDNSYSTYTVWISISRPMEFYISHSAVCYTETNISILLYIYFNGFVCVILLFSILCVFFNHSTFRFHVLISSPINYLRFHFQCIIIFYGNVYDHRSMHLFLFLLFFFHLYLKQILFFSFEYDLVWIMWQCSLSQSIWYQFNCVLLP